MQQMRAVSVVSWRRKLQTDFSSFVKFTPDWLGQKAASGQFEHFLWSECHCCWRTRTVLSGQSTERQAYFEALAYSIR